MSTYTWTAEKPTVPGWYWFKDPYGLICIGRILTRPDDDAALWTNDAMYTLSSVHGEFAGPIPEPHD